MLVLNRRPGESIVIEHGIHLTVLSVNDRRVWLCIEAPGVEPPVRVSATALSEERARLEIGAPRAIEIAGDDVRVEVGGEGHPAITTQATFSLNRSVGQFVAVGEGLRLGIGSVAKGNPCITMEGPSIGTGLRITLIRPAGSYVRIGVEAPDRRVYRKELWDDMVASNRAAADEDDDLSALIAGGRPAAGDGSSPTHDGQPARRLDGEAADVAADGDEPAQEGRAVPLSTGTITP